MDKTAKKTAKRGSGKPFRKGDDPRRGHGKKGRSGRPPEQFRKFLSQLRRDPEFHDALAAAVKDPNSRGFSSAIKVVTDYDTNRPAQRTDITTKGKAISGVVVLPPTETP